MHDKVLLHDILHKSLARHGVSFLFDILFFFLLKSIKQYYSQKVAEEEKSLI